MKNNNKKPINNNSKNIETKNAVKREEKLNKTNVENKPTLSNAADNNIQDKPKKNKKVKEKNSNKYDLTKFYSVNEAVELVKQASKAKFKESIDIAIKLNLDTTKSDQQLRGVVNLPYFFGKTKRILVLDKGLTQKDAKTLGVEYAGESDLVAEISRGWIDFDLIITTPKMMPELSKLGKILGSKGLMPNPKTGNVTTDLSKTIATFKQGVNNYRTDSYGNIHMIVGKVDADSKKIIENINFLLNFITTKKPSVVKGTFIENVTLSSTMGPGFKILISKPTSSKTKDSKVNQDSVTVGKDKITKEEMERIFARSYLKPIVKYIQKKKPTKNPLNPPAVITKKKQKPKYVKTKKATKKNNKKISMTSTKVLEKNNKKISQKTKNNKQIKANISKSKK